MPSLYRRKHVDARGQMDSRFLLPRILFPVFDVYRPTRELFKVYDARLYVLENQTTLKALLAALRRQIHTRQQTLCCFCRTPPPSTTEVLEERRYRYVTNIETVQFGNYSNMWHIGYATAIQKDASLNKV